MLVLEPTEDDPPTARTTMYAEVTAANGLVYGSDFEVDGERCRALSYEFAERL